jgi:glutathione peroxidase
MHKEYRDRGFEVLAYPCNQFGSQEPGSNKEIAEFVKQYNVEFPMMEKIHVMSKKQEPLYKWLRDNSDLRGGDMQWNFEKFLINGDGQIVGHWWASDEPNSIRKDIEKLLM